MNAGDKKPRRARRVVAGISALLLQTTVFLLALVAGAFLHLDTPLLRVSAARLVNVALAETFYGKLEIGRFSHLSGKRIVAKDIKMLDEQARTVIEMSLLSVELQTLDDLWDLLFGGVKINIVLPHVRGENAVVHLRPDALTGQPSIARAFEPKPSERKSAHKEPKSPRHIRLYLPSIELGQVATYFDYPGFEALAPILSGAHGSLLVSPRGVAVDVKRVGLSENQWSPKPVRGTGTMKLRSPGALGRNQVGLGPHAAARGELGEGPRWDSLPAGRGAASAPHVRLDIGFNGFLGDAELLLSGSLEDDHVKLNVAAPSLSPDAMVGLIPSWPFKDDARLELRAEGSTDAMQVDVEIGLGAAEVLAEGPIALSPAFGAELSAQVRHFDLRSLGSELPASSIDASGSLNLRATNAELVLDLQARTDATRVATVPIPPIEIVADYEGGTFSGEAQIFEPGSPISAEFTISDTISAGAQVPAFALQNQRRIPKGIHGLTKLRAKAELKNGVLKTDAEGDIARFSVGSVNAKTVSFKATATTPLAKPESTQVKAKLNANDLAVGPLLFQSAQTDLSATRAGAKVTARLSDADGRQVNLSGRVSRALAVRDATFSVRQRQVTVSGQVALLDVEKGLLNLTDLRIEGAGKSFAGRLRIQPGLIEAKLHGEKLDLGVLAKALGLPARSVAGTLTIHADLTSGSDLRRGTLQAEIERGSFKGFGDSNIKLFSTLEDHHVSGNLSIKDKLGIEVEGSWEIELAAHPLALAAWVDATGTAEWRVQGVPLTGGELLAPDVLSHLDGEVGARFLVERRTKGSWPTLFAELGVGKLELVLSTSNGDLPVPQLSPYVSAVFDGASSRLHLSSVLNDQYGPLVTATGAVEFEPGRWIESVDEAWKHFRGTPQSWSITVPKRTLNQFPLLKLGDQLSGQVELQLAFSQSIDSPRLSLVATGHDLVQPGRTSATPISLSLSADYTPLDGGLEAHVSGASAGRSVILGTFSGHIPPTALSSGAPWEAKATVSLDRFPLRVLAALADGGVDGYVSGWATLDTTKPIIEADLKLNNLTAGRANLGAGTLTLSGQPGKVVGHFSLGKGPRNLNVELTASGDSKQILLPHQINSIIVNLASNDFDAGAFAPLLEPTLARVGGGLDSKLELSLKKQPAKADQLPSWASDLSGSAHLSRGSAYIDALGLELREIDADLVVEPAGERTRISLNRLKAKARSESVNLEGHAQLLLEGLRVASGSTDLSLRQVPITLQGLNLGKATGRAEAEFQRRKNYDVPGPHFGKDFMLFDIELSFFSLEAARTASRELIDLSENRNIVVLQSVRAVESEPDILPYRFIVRLKDRVEFSLAELRLPLTGETQTDYTDAARLQGTIRLLPGGRIPLLGKVLEVTGGRVILNPEQPSNPAINISLSGRSDSGNPVFVTIGGTMQDPVTEPPPAELQSLLGGGTGSLLSGGVQALGVNQLLGDSFGQVELRVSSTSQDSDAQALAAQAKADDQRSYSAAVQIGENLWFEGSYHQSNATFTGDNSSFSGTLDYRIDQNWSLKTQLGNTGGSLDLLWEHRY